MSRIASGRLLLAAFALALAGPPARTLAEPRPVSAGVIGMRGDRLYFAPLDSSGIDEGWPLTILYRGRSSATGVVVRLLPGELAVGRVTTGSLPSRPDPRRIQILGEPPPVRARPLLRVGLPAPGRANLLFACDGAAEERPGLPASYRAESAGADSARFTRAAGGGPPWPDTLVVRSYAETADEEIALERGDLDVAVFWPGELSPHVRDDPRWHGHLTGVRRRGVVASIRLDGGARADSGAVGPALASLNREIFRGDLVAWSRVGADPGVPAPGAPGAEAVRITVDPACPGRWTMARFLERREPAPAGRDPRPEVRLVYIDAPIAPLDSLVLAVADHVRRGAYPPAARARADSIAAGIRGRAGSPTARVPGSASLTGSLGVIPWFALGCPLVCAPELRSYVMAIGPDALAGLAACRAGEGGR